MTIEQFARRRRMISEYLDHIFSERDRLDWVGAKGMTNPKFRDVVAAQERLLNAMEEMLHAR
ncbi:hypothetical protein [Solimonas soli]|uniref:hypothetical protein n=1 Tax=Solimonas soli TaxID=413479 RepID=UPI000480DEAB|nr:hypothetical protein [Solimonas soli]